MQYSLKQTFVVFISLFQLHQSSCFTNVNRQSPLSKYHNPKPLQLSSVSETVTARVVAAHSLIEKSYIKNKKSQTFSTYNPVSKLESNQDFQTTLSQRDKSFARSLVSSTIRHKGQIDVLLGALCNKYPPKCGKYSDMVVACLRMGTAQILFMDVADFAAVSATVDVLKHEKFQAPDKLVKFVNAILRRAVKEGKEKLDNETSCTDNIIPWLLEDWNKSYGQDTTLKMVQQFLNADAYQHVDLSLNIPHLHDDDNEEFVDNEIQKVVNEFESMGTNHGDITLLPNKSIRVKRGTENVVSKYPLYDEGRWWVQDVSSTLPAIGLISALNKRNEKFSDLHVVDMCSAPGGKASQLLSAGFGKVTAIESNQRRCRRLTENLQRLGLEERCDVIVSAGQDWTNKDGTNIAAVLVDVPCSATGTGNRRPDVLQKDTTDLKLLLEIQGILSNHCIDNILTVGGIMVYATCSLLKCESEDQVEKLMKRGDVETIPFTAGEIPGFDGAIDDNGWLRVLPGVLGNDMNYCDGFFVARLMKV